MSKEKAPIILDFSGNMTEAINRLEAILYTSGWNNYLIIDLDEPTESTVLFSLLREGAIAVGEVYYTFEHEFSEELTERATKYFHRLRKRDMDNIYLNAFNYFSGREPDIDRTDNGALFYPEINAYVRCGNLSPEKLFDLMRQDGCERVIIFGSSLRYNEEQPWEAFHSFEMRAPKEYIMDKLNKLHEERMEVCRKALEASGANKIFEKIIPLVCDDED